MKGAARDARANKNERAVAHGKTHAQKRTEIQETGVEKSRPSMQQTNTENENGPVRRLSIGDHEQAEVDDHVVA